jgi:hypothetical protein
LVQAASVRAAALAAIRVRIFIESALRQIVGDQRKAPLFVAPQRHDDPQNIRKWRAPRGSP